MNFDLEQIFPEGLTDKEISHLADIFMELALAVEAHYYPRLVRYNKSLSQEASSLENDEFPF